MQMFVKIIILNVRINNFKCSFVFSIICYSSKIFEYAYLHNNAIIILNSNYEHATSTIICLHTKSIVLIIYY